MSPNFSCSLHVSLWFLRQLGSLCSPTQPCYKTVSPVTVTGSIPSTAVALIWFQPERRLSESAKWLKFQNGNQMENLGEQPSPVAESFPSWVKMNLKPHTHTHTEINKTIQTNMSSDSHKHQNTPNMFQFICQSLQLKISFLTWTKLQKKGEVTLKNWLASSFLFCQMFSHVHLTDE